MAEGSSFKEKTDRYSGVTVDMKDVHLNEAEFEKLLKGSLEKWKDSRKHGIWFKVHLEQAAYVPLLAKNGFDFHHAKKGYVMMTKWLPSKGSLPLYAFTTVGVAGLVVNQDNEILVVKDKHRKVSHWKFPGGYANPGEEFSETAQREVREETGIETEFISVVAFRHNHKHFFGCSDLYIVCLMKPKTKDIHKCPYEIADAKWMKLDEFKSHAEGNGLSRLCVKAFEDCQRRGVCLGYSDYFSHITKQFQKVYHIKPAASN